MLMLGHSLKTNFSVVFRAGFFHLVKSFGAFGAPLPEARTLGLAFCFLVAGSALYSMRSSSDKPG